MNKPKKQGTEAETRIVKLHQEHAYGARRLAEGGRNDKGDVEVLWLNQGNPDLIIGEVKDRERLNAHDALDEAARKAGTHQVALFWTKRSMKNPTIGVRRSVTQRLVAIPEEFWLELIGGKPHDLDGV